MMITNLDMSREKLITVYEIPEFTEGDPYIRVPSVIDRAVSTVREDRETGEYITLWEEKLRYPYKTKVASKLIVKTTKRAYTFILKLDDSLSFCWNGQNLPIIFWSFLGISKDSPCGLIASKWHDNLLYYKKEFLKEIRAEIPQYTIGEFRRLTSLIFRQLLVNNGVGRIKACIMSYFVDMWQRVSPKWHGVK